MVTILVRISEELAERLASFWYRLGQIIELGLQRWQSLPETDLKLRQRIDWLLP
jgi:hypothetical protein